MTKLSKNVNLKPFDPKKLNIEKIEGKELYTVHLPLDSITDQIWRQCFDRERKASPYRLKRNISIYGDELRAVTAPNELKSRIEWIKGLVNRANNCVDDYNKKMKQKEAMERAERKRVEETIKKMRKSLE